MANMYNGILIGIYNTKLTTWIVYKEIHGIELCTKHARKKEDLIYSAMNKNMLQSTLHITNLGGLQCI